MLHCINGLKANNKLKYQARLQLTSFFNSCGMSCEDDLEYQKSFYTRVIPEEKFTRSTHIISNTSTVRLAGVSQLCVVDVILLEPLFQLEIGPGSN